MSDPSPRSAEGRLEEASTLSTVGLVAGIIGLTAFANGLVLYAIDPGALGLTIIDVVFALTGVVFYALTNRAALARVASGRSTAMVIGEALLAVGVIAGAIAANYFASKSTVEWDLTRDRLYTLEEQSIKTASALNKKVHVIGFYKPADNMRTALKQLVELYSRYTDKIDLDLVNPDAAPPAVIKKFNITATGPKIVVFTEERQAKLRLPSEDEMTNALVRIAERPAKKVYFLGGHGEPRVDDDKETGMGHAAQGTIDAGYELGALNLIDQPKVPADAAAVVIASPKSALFPNEVAAIEGFIEAGGRALFMLEPGVDSGLEVALKKLGVEVGDNLVIDPNPTSKSLGFGPDAPLVRQFEQHPIMEPLRQRGLPILLYWARSVGPLIGAAGVSRVSTLFESSQESWGETKFRKGGDVERDEDDLPGPVPLAVALTRNAVAVLGKVNDQARLVVVGDAHFASNKLYTTGANGDFYIAAVEWLVGEEAKISIRPRSRHGTSLPLTEAQQLGIIFFSVNVLPLLIIGIGFSVWAVRRRK